MTGHHGGRKDGLLDILGRGGCHFFLILSFMFYGQAYGNACSDIISTESVWDAGIIRDIELFLFQISCV